MIDPGEAEPIEVFLKNRNLDLKQIWVTHHHSDHQRGSQKLQQIFSCEIVGPKQEAEKIPGINIEVTEGDMLPFSDTSAQVIKLPGHTLGHVGYWFKQEGIFFCGDTLFSLGCGYLFEGSYQDMWGSLCKIRTLPPKTLLYFGHEYTQDNARFALSVDPNNPHLIAYCHEVDQKREGLQPTVPTTVDREILTNPFLRADNPHFEKQLKMPQAKPVEIFKNLRNKKNEFKASF